MTAFDFDLFTIGAGSGGVRASRVAAGTHGARVAVAEDLHLGGTCVNLGCIPKKLLVYASHYGEDFADARGFGWRIDGRTFDWGTLVANKDREIERLNGVYRRVLEQSGATLFEGRARLVDPHTVEVDGRRHTARHVLVATGSWPWFPEIPGIEHAVTSNEAFHLDRLPERVLVVGGGYIGVEFAGIFHGLGANVTVAHRGSLFLRGFDDELRETLADEMRRRGISLRFETNVTSIERAETGLRVAFDQGDALEVDLALFATGRRPKTRDLGLEECGVELTRDGAVVVDELSRSSVESIHAIGDCTDRMMLTPVAIAEGMALARTLFGGEPTKPDYAGVPSCVFSQPSLGTVGLTEAEARERHGEVDVYRSRFRPLRHTLTGREETTVVKLVVERSTDRVLGCHMLGPEAGEIIQGFAVALKCGATKRQFDATVGIHPTAAEEFVTLR